MFFNHKIVIRAHIMYPNRTPSNSKSSSGNPKIRSPAECMPLDSRDNFPYGHDLPVMGPTPPWLKRRHNPPANASPSPKQLYMIPPPEIISVPRQAKHLQVLPPPEDPVLRDHVPRAKGGKARTRPQNIVVPASRPIALATVHTPLAVPPPISAVFPAPAQHEDRSAPATPYTPEPSPYIHPGMTTGLPRALGMRAFPIRADGPWRHGG
ncbi:hypothetical protein DFH07DRAFT_306271 [Mycena maculata]|uniref:Uncharacterized protein n=1 Tax=Mycena maculata TaxID=230809 RepID=A0AAD7HHY2_9AGAR|nr:hypothetical protein DFH07DRAFT_306271 [Mycena maculata]